MKTLLLTIIGVISILSFCYSDVFVKSYYRKDGTYVDSYHRSNPDNKVYNNYSYNRCLDN